jgi:hypothetical protein
MANLGKGKKVGDMFAGQAHLQKDNVPLDKIRGGGNMLFDTI